MSERADTAIAKLNEALKELDGFLSISPHDAWERIKRWKDRTVRLIAEVINESEAGKFSEREVMWNNVVASVTIKNNVRTQSAIIRSLIDDLPRNPDDFFGAAPNPHVPGTPLNSTFESAFRLIHPSIVQVSKSRFTSGQYADAAEAAIKLVNTRVKTYYKDRTGEEKDGVDLMRKAFTPKNPVVVLDDPGTETGFNIQQGYMDIFAGSISAIRNPKAHEIIHIDSTRAIHFLFVASLEMFKLDEAKVP